MITEKHLNTLKNEYWHPEPKALREALSIIASIKTSDTSPLVLKQEIVAEERVLRIEFWDGEVYFSRILPLLHCTVSEPLKIFLLLAPLQTALAMAKDIAISIEPKAANVAYISDEVAVKFSTVRCPYYYPLTPPYDSATAEFNFNAPTIKAAVHFAEYAAGQSSNLIFWTEEFLQGNFNMNSFRLKASPAPTTIGFRTKDLLVIAALLTQSSQARYKIVGSRLWLGFAWGWMSVGVNSGRTPRWRDITNGQEPIGNATVVREDLMRSVRLMKLYPFTSAWTLSASGSQLRLVYKHAAAFLIGRCDFSLEAEKVWLSQDNLKVLLQALPVQEEYLVRVSQGGLAFTAKDSLYTISAVRNTNNDHAPRTR